jgi:hypothetical protein
VCGVVKFHEVTKPEVQLDHQIQGDTWQRSMNSEESVSEGNKGGGCNISKPEVTKGWPKVIAHGHIGERV